jgi:predicted DCC family thiol-disulfide oxidoreductase YuxK
MSKSKGAMFFSEGGSMSEDAKKITVYYDGACPQCVRDRHHYEKLAGKHRERIGWFDITGREEHLRELGIDPRKALTELRPGERLWAWRGLDQKLPPRRLPRLSRSPTG